MITEIYLYELNGKKSAIVYRKGKHPRGYWLKGNSASRIANQIHTASLNIDGRFRPVLSKEAFGFTFVRSMR